MNKTKKEKIVKIRYVCKHLSCNMDCHEGVIELSEHKLSELKAFFREDNLFKSPSGLCKIGFTQDLEIISVDHIPSVSGISKEEILGKYKNRLMQMIQKHRKDENQLKDEIIKLELEIEAEK